VERGLALVDKLIVSDPYVYLCIYGKMYMIVLDFSLEFSRITENSKWKVESPLF
jgi:hypothetical protein